jgi:hypothetical protein
MVSSVWLLLGRHTSTINRGFIRSSSSATEGVGLKKNIIMEDGIPCELGRSDEWKGDGCFIKRVAPSTRPSVLMMLFQSTASSTTSPEFSLFASLFMLCKVC